MNMSQGLAAGLPRGKGLKKDTAKNDSLWYLLGFLI
jgi:hypothetical protein